MRLPRPGDRVSLLPNLASAESAFRLFGFSAFRRLLLLRRLSLLLRAATCVRLHAGAASRMSQYASFRIDSSALRGYNSSD